MYLVVSVPETNDYVKIDNLIVSLMETKGFAILGVASGLGTREIEFQDEKPLPSDDNELIDLEAELRQLIQTTELKLFVED